MKSNHGIEEGNLLFEYLSMKTTCLYKPSEVLVVGDDLYSEIKAAKELGIETVIYNHNRERPEANGEPTIKSFKEIMPYLN